MIHSGILSVLILNLQTFVLCEYTIPTLSELGKYSRELNECGRCKTLVKSYNHWFSKTERGQHEGGDAAWEETKLRSYARSEMRLVDIQESLCSELKNNQEHCYTLAGEAEQALEDWWFREDVDSQDFYTWLCIETLKYCCPKNHFGELCGSCLLDVNNKVCSGHGKCHGDESRKGNGTCMCDRGYSGSLCDQCSKNFYMSNKMCLACHKSCESCTSGSATDCVKCNKGWELQLDRCIDIDECADASTCLHNQFCVNREGSFVCKPCDKTCQTCSGDGEMNCTSCSSSDIMWDGMCITKTQKEEILNRAISRALVYLCLLVSCYFVYRNSKKASCFFIVMIAVYIYYYEKITPIKTFESLFIYLKFLMEN